MGWTMKGDGEGMETWILLARSQPFVKSDEDLQALLSSFPTQRTLRNPQAVVWFDNGNIVRHDRKRDPQFFESAINDPVLELQALLQQRLQQLADFTTAVAFAKIGK